ncbi:endonuclease/exonuclease/phosphatase family protein [Paeniglutamicibacter sp. R2-26]|uniref:endonuclease/exonuclease/phosphatase family protein n=1 Tax=Paeniglutamicibacter sp. R2-26 TaxID=3144417 RepID=UPI003EE46C65
MVRYPNMLALGVATLAAAAAIGLAPAHAQATPVSQEAAMPVPYPDSLDGPARGLRVATFNASLHRESEGQLKQDLSGTDDPQARAVAEVIQRNAPDILLLNEFDFDAAGNAAGLFRENYLAVSQRGQLPVDYPYIYLAPSNTGVPSGADLDGDGVVGGAADAFGYGDFEGQFAMVLYSKYPIDASNARTFRHFLWKDMPHSRLPAGYYDDLVQGVLRLPSKSMWDVPVKVGTQTVHVIAAHPTPPAFDGPEERNKRRNHDEIRLVNDYIGGGDGGAYIYDDAGVRGPLAPGSAFVVLGDLNSDPAAGDSDPASIDALRGNPLLADPLEGRPTADFGRGEAGVMRVDYVLPSASFRVDDAGVYWPGPGQGGSDLIEGWPPPSSDHRLVWVELGLPG